MYKDMHTCVHGSALMLFDAIFCSWSDAFRTPIHIGRALPIGRSPPVLLGCRSPASAQGCLRVRMWQRYVAWQGHTVGILHAENQHLLCGLMQVWYYDQGWTSANPQTSQLVLGGRAASKNHLTDVSCSRGSLIPDQLLVVLDCRGFLSNQSIQPSGNRETRKALIWQHQGSTKKLDFTSPRFFGTNQATVV
jgi:hypothetical protein